VVDCMIENALLAVGHWEYVRQMLLSEASVWPCGPYPMLDEDEDGNGDGWVHYDTSNWKPAS